jgi:hypothetical protein
MLAFERKRLTRSALEYNSQNADSVITSSLDNTTTSRQSCLTCGENPMSAGRAIQFVSTLLATAAIGLGGCTAGVTTAPPVIAKASGAPPVLDEITQKTLRPMAYDVVVNEVHFHDPDGDVRFVHRELVETNGPDKTIVDGVVRLPPEMQKRGAIFAGEIRCGPNSYYIKLRAYLVDEAGNRSNAMDYTVHCNGG